MERETDTNEDEIDEEVIKKFNRNRKKYGAIYDELEILQDYNLYLTVAEQIRTRNLKTETLNNFKEKVKELSKHSVFTVEKIPPCTAIICTKYPYKEKDGIESKQICKKRKESKMIFIYLILGYWAARKTIYANKIRIGTWMSLVMTRIMAWQLYSWDGY